VKNLLVGKNREQSPKLTDALAQIDANTAKAEAELKNESNTQIHTGGGLSFGLADWWFGFWKPKFELEIFAQGVYMKPRARRKSCVSQKSFQAALLDALESCPSVRLRLSDRIPADDELHLHLKSAVDRQWLQSGSRLKRLSALATGDGGLQELTGTKPEAKASLKKMGGIGFTGFNVLEGMAHPPFIAPLFVLCVGAAGGGVVETASSEDSVGKLALKEGQCEAWKRVIRIWHSLENASSPLSEENRPRRAVESKDLGAAVEVLGSMVDEPAEDEPAESVDCM